MGIRALGVGLVAVLFLGEPVPSAPPAREPPQTQPTHIVLESQDITRDRDVGRYHWFHGKMSVDASVYSPPVERIVEALCAEGHSILLSKMSALRAQEYHTLEAESMLRQLAERDIGIQEALKRSAERETRAAESYRRASEQGHFPEGEMPFVFQKTCVQGVQTMEETSGLTVSIKLKSHYEAYTGGKASPYEQFSGSIVLVKDGRPVAKWKLPKPYWPFAMKRGDRLPWSVSFDGILKELISELRTIGLPDG